MAKSNTTNVAYYFARRKDTGMAGVWFTHCAANADKTNIINRLIKRAESQEDMVILVAGAVHDTRFRVKFLEENFAKVVREYCKGWYVSIAHALHMQVLREAGHNINQMP